MSEPTNTYQEFKPTVGHRISRFLFPMRASWPMDESYGFVESGCRITVETHFGLLDRLRVLVSGKTCTDVRVQGDRVFLKSRATSIVSVRAPWDRCR